MDAIYLLLLASLLFLAIGGLMERILDVSMLDFKGVYYSASCLLHGDDPYKPGEVLRLYQLSAAKPFLRPGEVVRQVLAQYFYLSGQRFCTITAPVALLAFGPAHLVWMALNAASLVLAAVLIWEVSEKYFPLMSTSLIGLLLATSGSVLAIGNAAGIAVGLCVVGVWCFLRQRWVAAGVFCMAMSLTVEAARLHPYLALFFCWRNKETCRKARPSDDCFGCARWTAGHPLGLAGCAKLESGTQIQHGCEFRGRRTQRYRPCF